MISLLPRLRREFAGYSLSDLQADILAGLTVAAVALPLALAFGVASGADAAAGLVTAVIGGILIAALGGSPFQISGPTGAMSAVLIVVAIRHGLTGVWLASFMAGVLIILLGVLRLGRMISFIPSPVITGFTSGIALIIAFGQIDAVLGLQGAHRESIVAKLQDYLRDGIHPNLESVLTAAIVILTMLLLPQVASSLPRPLRRIPGSLVGIAVATGLVAVLGWQVDVIGEIPRSILLEQRLTLDAFDPALMGELIVPALSIAALGAIESLLCGAVAGSMTGTKLDSDAELLAQGIGNVVVPFFGGVPATAAIARTSVAIRSGARTRLTSIVHGLALLGAALIAAPLIARVPLAALGGVLMVTAVRMNEWEAIRFFINGRHRHALISMLVTMVATVVLDLTQAILIGVAVSIVFFLRQASAISVSCEAVDPERLRDRGHDLTEIAPDVRVVYVTGPLFFGSAHRFLESLRAIPASARIILSMRGVPTIDATGIKAIEEVIDRQLQGGGEVHFAGLQPRVARLIEQSSIGERLGNERVHWSADHAILAVHEDSPAAKPAS